MKRKILSILAICVLSCGAFAQEGSTEIKTAAAKTAIAESETRIAAARAVFDKAALEAKKAMLPKLKAALLTINRVTSPEEARNIEELISLTEIEIAELSSNGTMRVVSVPATLNNWTSGGTYIKGQRLRITTIGSWRYGKDESTHTYANGRGVKVKASNDDGKMLCRIGSTDIDIGVGIVLTVPENGTIEFRIRDQGVYDNSGAITVKVETLRP